MTDVLSAPSLLSEASDSELEVSSLCGSELELEMAWGEGPIAPLRTEPPADQGVPSERPGSRGNGSARARTPQKRGSESPLARSKRLINIHPIRSVPYLPTPNELPVGVRKQQRWFNGTSSLLASRRRLAGVMGVIDGSWRSDTDGRPSLWQPRGVHAPRGPDGAHADQRRVAVSARLRSC